MKKVTIKIADMHCASCAFNISKNLLKANGIRKADVNFPLAQAIIEFDENLINPDQFKKIIKETGYHVKEDFDDRPGQGHEHHGHEKMSHQDHEKKELIAAFLFSLPVIIRMFWQWEIPGSLFDLSATSIAVILLTSIIVFYFGFRFHRSTVLLLAKKQTNMDTLISVGTLSAYFYSLWSVFNGGHLYFDSAATITVLILLGHYLEMKTRSRASLAMEKLKELGAKNANLIKDNEEIVETKIEEININEIILVKPGEKIPLDGEIVEC